MEIMCSCLACSLNGNGFNPDCQNTNLTTLQLCSGMSRMEQVYENQNKKGGTATKQRNKHCKYSNHYGPSSLSSITDLADQWNSINTSIVLNDGVQSPVFGLGVHGAKPGKETIDAVHWALKEGYRMIDTASRYDNEQSVGEAVRTSGIPREDIFVITKLYDDDHGYDETLAAFSKSLSRLGLDYVDMYLIHAPVPDKVVPSWKAMIELKNQGLIRSLGVSNFGVHHLKELRKHTNVVPSVNQIELHPFLQEVEVVKYCQQNGILLQAYSPMTRGEKLDNPILRDISRELQRTPAQVVLRWSIQNGYIPLPKSSKKERIRENANVFDFEIPPNVMEILNNLEEDFRTGKNKIGRAWNG